MIMIKNAWKLWWYARKIFVQKKTYSEWLCLYGRSREREKPCGAVFWLYKMHYYDDEYHRGMIIVDVVVIIIICFFSLSRVLRGVRRKVLHATSPV